MSRRSVTQIESYPSASARLARAVMVSRSASAPRPCRENPNLTAMASHLRRHKEGPLAQSNGDRRPAKSMTSRKARGGERPAESAGVPRGPGDGGGHDAGPGGPRRRERPGSREGRGAPASERERRRGGPGIQG